VVCLHFQVLLVAKQKGGLAENRVMGNYLAGLARTDFLY
jgi:hypothetical protein